MKICVFSDSHGYADNMKAAVGIEKPDMIIFLGDGIRDFEEVTDMFPDIPAYAVKGNCDYFSMLKNSVTIEAEGAMIFATHGHLSYVKHDPELETLTSQAREAGADVALFGHTHRQHLSENYGVLLVNPGTAGFPNHPNYAVLNITNGVCSAELK